MSITIKNKTLIESVAAIQCLGQLKLPISSIRPMAKILRILQGEWENVQAVQNALATGAPVQEPQEKEAAFKKRVDDYNKSSQKQWELFEKESFSLEIDKISIALLGEDQKEFTAGHLMTLDWLIEF